jgi:hypothetical protein
MSALRRGAREGAGEEGSRQRGKRQWRVGKAARANEQENQESRATKRRGFERGVRGANRETARASAEARRGARVTRGRVAARKRASRERVPLVLRLELLGRDHNREDGSARGAYARLFVRARGGRAGRPGRLRAVPRREGLRRRRLGARRPLGRHRAPPRAREAVRAGRRPAVAVGQKVKNQAPFSATGDGNWRESMFSTSPSFFIGRIGLSRRKKRKKGQFDPKFRPGRPIKPPVNRSKKISPPWTLDSVAGSVITRWPVRAPRGTGAFFRNERFRDGDARVRREGVRPPLARVGVGVRCCSSRW